MGIVPGLHAFPDTAEASGDDLVRDWAIQAELATTATALLAADGAAPATIAKLIEDGARRLTGSRLALVGWWEAAEGVLEVPVTARADWPDPRLGALEEHGAVLAVREPGGAVGWVLAQARPLIVGESAESLSAGPPPFDRVLAVPALDAGVPAGVVCLAGSHRDYTGRDLAAIGRLANLLALALRRSRAEAQRTLLAGAVEQAPVSFVITDGAGAIRYVNPAFTRATGFTREEALGNNPRLLKSGYTAASEYQRLWTALTHGRIWRGEFHNRRKNQELYWEAAAVAPLRDPAGAIDGFVAVKDDITKRKAMEIDLIAAKEAAEEASRAKSTFLAHVSHELRTPLNAIIGFAEIMDRQLFGPVGDSHYRDYARYIGDSGRHLLALINDILDLAKVEAGRMDMTEEAVDMEAAVDITCTLLRGRAETGRVLLEAGWAESPPLLRADARMVRQILLNIVSNAVKFTPPEGRVTISGHRDAAGELVIDVTDTGPGLSQDDLAIVLAPFGQLRHPVRPPESGSGLGLPLAKSLTELHGGSLSITSSPQAGTTVTISFPAHRVLADGV